MVRKDPPRLAVCCLSPCLRPTANFGPYGSRGRSRPLARRIYVASARASWRRDRSRNTLQLHHCSRAVNEIARPLSSALGTLQSAAMQFARAGSCCGAPALSMGHSPLTNRSTKLDFPARFCAIWPSVCLFARVSGAERRRERERGRGRGRGRGREREREKLI